MTALDATTLAQFREAAADMGMVCTQSDAEFGEVWVWAVGVSATLIIDTREGIAYAWQGEYDAHDGAEHYVAATPDEVDQAVWMAVTQRRTMGDRDFAYLYLIDAEGDDRTPELMAEWAQITPPARREQVIQDYVTRVEEGLHIAGEATEIDPVARLMAMVSAHIDAQP